MSERRMRVSWCASDGKRDALRAIKALADAVDQIDAGNWLVLVRDTLPHVEANVKHLREQAEYAREVTA